jgi:hypothetical protein
MLFVRLGSGVRIDIPLYLIFFVNHYFFERVLDTRVSSHKLCGPDGDSETQNVFSAPSVSYLYSVPTL